MRVVVVFFLTAFLLCGNTFKLYLKDGTYHVVREYQIEPDRVRYYSTERGEWEEIPTDLVDLDKTQHERNSHEEQQAESARQQDEEDKAEREQQREINSIPLETGAYYKQDGKIKTLQQAEYQIITSKTRRTLQALSPVPLVPGKASVVIKGDHAAFTVSEDRPDFILRLEKEERFGILALTPKRGMRVVEDISIVPITKENVEQAKQTDTFQQELASGLYRIWPQKTLAPGQYALVEYSDQPDAQEIALLIWDFAVRPGAAK